jgi:hypothetical protein
MTKYSPGKGELLKGIRAKKAPRHAQKWRKSALLRKVYHQLDKECNHARGIAFFIME